jgi:hypothetical protein
MIIFDAAANNIVTDKIEPSYTSVNQKLKGVAPILNKKTVKIKKKPQKYVWYEKLAIDEINSNDIDPKNK